MDKNKLEEKRIHHIFGETTKEKLSDSTIHGCAAFFRSEYWTVRFMWLICGLAMIGYCIYMVYMSLTEYFSYSVTVDINRVHELPATFPAVTICNLNPFNEKYAYNFLINKAPQLECFNNTDGNVFAECIGTNDTNHAFNIFVDKLKRIIASSHLTPYEQWYNGFDLSLDMLLSCSYNGFTCTANDFTKFWSNMYGNCFTYNHGTSKNTSNDTSNLLKTSVTGEEYGLHLELAVRRYRKFKKK